MASRSVSALRERLPFPMSGGRPFRRPDGSGGAHSRGARTLGARLDVELDGFSAD